MKRTIAAFIVTLSASGCTLGPNYGRPPVDVPGEFRGPSAPGQTATDPAAPQAKPPAAGPAQQPAAGGAGRPDQAPQDVAPSIASQKWWELFQDPELQQLVRAALEHNYDLRIASTRILQAQALLGITRADQFPTISAGAVSTTDRYPQTKLAPDYETSATSVSGSAVWALDFWASSAAPQRAHVPSCSPRNGGDGRSSAR